MLQEFSQEELKALALQLGCPSGDAGIAIGEIMNTSNIGMTTETIFSLQLSDGEQVLELGHGNAAHLSEIFQQAEGLHYTGLEISQTMQTEAQQLNMEFCRKNQAVFHCYDGHTLPLESNSFHKIFTVNTIYFWENPERLLAELYRVLRPKGLLAITFAQKEFMQTLPFVQFGFRIYNTADILDLTQAIPFDLYNTFDISEEVQNKVGKNVVRDSTVLLLKKY